MTETKNEIDVGALAASRNQPEQRHVAVPGELLLSPVVVLSVAALLLNDHYLKARFHNALTGKLSDFAGLIVFPCVLIALVEWALFARVVVSAGARQLARQPHYRLTTQSEFGASALEVILACGATALAFTAIKVSVVASDIYCWGVTSVRLWLHVPWFAFTKNVADSSDLVALPALLVPLWLALYRRRPGGRRPAPQTRAKLDRWPRKIPRSHSAADKVTSAA